MAKGLPDSIKIGPYRFSVEVKDDAFVSRDETTVLSGDICYHEGAIRLARGTPEFVFATFWHEVPHGADYVAGTKLSEEKVGRLADVLAAVLLDNGYADPNGGKDG